MPRFKLNRWWTPILTITALLAVSAAFVSSSHADPIRESNWYWNDPTLNGGAPPPSGVGDPDQPTPSTSLKISQRQTMYGATSDRELLSYRTAGDSRFESNVWMMRLSVMARLMRSYWFRF
jgi:hypothetical protein